MDLTELELDGGCDFLGGDLQASSLAQAVDQVRPALCEWTAGAILARHPTLQRYRGSKGRRAWEQDLDFLLRQLDSGLSTTPQERTGTAEWLQDTLLARGVDRTASRTAIALLQEGLLRHLGSGRGRDAARRLGELLQFDNNARTLPWL